MEKLARKLANNIAISQNYDDEKKAVVAYGLTGIIQISTTIFLILILSLILDIPAEAMTVCLSGSVLKKYSGGAHADTAELCTAVSVSYCTLSAVIARRLLLPVYNPFIASAAVILIIGSAYLVLYRYAPVDSPNKPIKTEKKRKRMRKGSFIIVSALFAIALIMIALSSKAAVFGSCVISLLFGLAWQVLTLTPIGTILLNKLNAVFNSSGKEVHLK